MKDIENLFQEIIAKKSESYHTSHKKIQSMGGKNTRNTFNYLGKL